VSRVADQQRPQAVAVLGVHGPRRLDVIIAE
jgi:L-lactate utilization protein LutC